MGPDRPTGPSVIEIGALGVTSLLDAQGLGTALIARGADMIARGACVTGYPCWVAPMATPVSVPGQAQVIEPGGGNRPWHRTSPSDPDPSVSPSWTRQRSKTGPDHWRRTQPRSGSDTGSRAVRRQPPPGRASGCGASSAWTTASRSRSALRAAPPSRRGCAASDRPRSARSPSGRRPTAAPAATAAARPTRPSGRWRHPRPWSP